MKYVYLDNGATSYPKAPGVAESISNYILNVGTNVNRGAYSSSFKAENTVYETRELLCELFNFNKPENVIFTKKKKYTEVIKVFLNLGKVSIELKAYYSAISYLKQAESVYESNSIGDDYALGEIYYNLANVYYIIEKEDQSKKYAYLAKEKFEQINNKEAYAKSLMASSEEIGRAHV